MTPDFNHPREIPAAPPAQQHLNGRWDAAEYFRNLTARNRLARELDFRFFEVSDLQGFEDALHAAGDTQNFICVSDTSDGVLELQNTPHIRQVKTVFMAMRHSETSDRRMELRAECFETMREIMRQFMSVLSKERTAIEEGLIHIDTQVAFSEINRYFFTGCACAYFQISVTSYSNLIFRKEEWL